MGFNRTFLGTFVRQSLAYQNGRPSARLLASSFSPIDRSKVSGRNGNQFEK